MKIVVADDSQVMRRLVLRALRHAGFDNHECIEAGDGVTAIEAVREHDPDLVLSDWRLSRKTGIQVLRDLRTQGFDVPFGFVTSESSPARRREAAQAGAAFLISKPFTPELFEDALSGVLSYSEDVPSATTPVGPTPRPPSAKQVKDVFEGLLGRGVTLSDGSPVLLDTRTRPTTAVYVDDRNRLSAVALMDLALTAWSGAALALLPRGGAEDAIDQKDLPASLLENAAELLDVLAAPIGDASGVHQRLHQTFGPDQVAPSDVLMRCTQLSSRIDVRLDIAGYGQGTLSVISTVTPD